jgi:hypothetical protein
MKFLPLVLAMAVAGCTAEPPEPEPNPFSPEAASPSTKFHRLRMQFEEQVPLLEQAGVKVHGLRTDGGVVAQAMGVEVDGECYGTCPEVRVVGETIEVPVAVWAHTRGTEQQWKDDPQSPGPWGNRTEPRR